MRAIPYEVIVGPRGRWYRPDGDRDGDIPFGRTAAEVVAPTAAPLAARSGRYRGRYDAPPELRRDRPGPTQPRDGAAPRRGARRAAARTEQPAGRRRLRADVPPERPGRPVVRHRADRARPDPPGPRAVSRHRRRPSVAAGVSEHGGDGARRGRRRAAARTAGERPAGEPAPEGPRPPGA